MPLSVFIDTSIYLSFFSVSNDDLEQLSKITKLIQDDQIKLLIPRQVEREVVRNRDNKLAGALAELEKAKTKLPLIPRFMNDYDEVKSFRNFLMMAERERSKAISRAKSEASSLATNADIVIQSIFNAAGIVEESELALSRAQKRMLVGDPPGKPDSIGDRINWEEIIISAESGLDLHVVSRDGDFFSILTPTDPNFALKKEWNSIKGSNLHVHPEIKRFLAQNFSEFDFSIDRTAINNREISRKSPDYTSIRFDGEWAARKQDAIESLGSASDVEELVSAIEKLNRSMSHISSKDIKTILDISVNNPMVYEYGLDDLVRNFYWRLIPRALHFLNKEEIRELENIFDIEFDSKEYESESDDLTLIYQQATEQELEDFVDASVEENNVETS